MPKCYLQPTIQNVAAFQDVVIEVAATSSLAVWPKHMVNGVVRARLPSPRGARRPSTATVTWREANSDMMELDEEIRPRLSRLEAAGQSLPLLRAGEEKLL